MSTSIQFNGKEVRNPLLRVLVVGIVVVLLVAVVVVMVVGIMIFMPALLIILGVAVALFILSIPVHIVLRLMGRRGFYVRKGNRFIWTNIGAFQRR